MKNFIKKKPTIKRDLWLTANILLGYGESQKMNITKIILIKKKKKKNENRMENYNKL